MKSIAEFVMRGRTQSLIVAVPGAGTEIFFWLSAAVVGLVTMRKGTQHGLFVLLWALLPAAALVWLKFPPALMCLLSCFVMAAILRATQQWNIALLGGAASCMLMATVLQFGFQAYLQGILDIIKPVLEEIFTGKSEDKAVTQLFEALGTSELAGAYGAGAGFFAVIALALARYWQSVLYNPDAFGEEFRALRYKAPTAMGLVLFAALLFSAEGYRIWAWMCLLPLLVAGVGLMHYLLNRIGAGKPVMFVFYAGLLLADPVKQLVCALALADSVMNIRRLKATVNKD